MEETQAAMGTHKSGGNVLGALAAMTRKYGLFLVLLIALLRGLAYASMLPPWGIIDEEQHFHYIQYLAEERRLPRAGTTYISDTIIASLVETQRWERFGLQPPASEDPREMGLEGLSYEAYQPPLYYLIMVPLYELGRGGVLSKLFLLRWASVTISTLTAAVTYALAKAVTRSTPLSLLAALFLALIPERTMATSRVNNDVLLELASVGFLWAASRATIDGMRDRQAVLLGLLLGLGVLSKMSAALLIVCLPFVAYANRRKHRWKRGILITLGVLLLLAGPWAARNIALYGDPTGFASIRPWLNYSPPPMTSATLMRGLVDSFKHFWVIWWQGASAASDPNLAIFFLLMLALTIYSLISLIQAGNWPGRSVSKPSSVLLGLSFGAIITYAAFVQIGYLRGIAPLIQGRFLLPVAALAATLFISGLDRAKYGTHASALAILGLMAVDSYSLWGNLLMQYYPLADLTGGGLIGARDGLTALGALAHLAGQHKPASITNGICLTFAGYFVSHILALLTLAAIILSPREEPA